MNKKGQYVFYGVMMFILAFIIVVVVSPTMKTLVDTTRDPTHLDCDNESITSGTALGCVAVDLVIPYFIITVILVGAGYLLYRQVAGG